LIINNKSLFARAIYLDTVISFLTHYTTSIRSNRNEQLAKEMYQKLVVEIEGANDGVISVKGLKPQLISEIASIRKEIEKLQEGYFGIGYNIITED